MPTTALSLSSPACEAISGSSASDGTNRIYNLYGTDLPSLEAVANADADGLVEHELVSLARSQGGLRMVLALLCARLVEESSWERLGNAQLSEYAGERLGRSSRTVRDLARVGSVLPKLPRLRCALASGALGWTKVRLVARVATVSKTADGDEAAWIALAHRLTADALSREVRKLDSGSLENDGFAHDRDPGRFVEFACTREVVCLWARARRTANRVHGGLLRVGECAELVVAETLSAMPIDPGRLEEEEETAAIPEDGEQAPTSADVAPLELWPRSLDTALDSGQEVRLSPALASLLDGLAEADAFSLDGRLRTAFDLERRFEARLGPLLASVLLRGVYRAFGYRTREAYVRERLGLDPSWCRLLLRLERAACISPAFERAYRAGRLSALQASALIPLVLAELEESHVARWIELARVFALPRLRDEIDRALLLRETEWQVWLRTGGLPEAAESDEELEAEAQREIGAEPTESESCTIRMIVDTEVAQMLRALLRTVRRRAERETHRLPTKGEAFGIICLHVLREWGADPTTERQIPRAHRIFERDGWRCSVPGCTSQKNLHAHHIVPRSAGGGNEPSNLTTLCAYHHLRGVHAGRIEVTGRAPLQLRVSLGLRAGQLPLVVYLSGGRLKL